LPAAPLIASAKSREVNTNSTAFRRCGFNASEVMNSHPAPSVWNVRCRDSPRRSFPSGLPPDPPRIGRSIKTAKTLA